MANTKDTENLSCSFCGKKRFEVKKLIAGPSSYICNECISISHKILNDEEVDTFKKTYNITDNKQLPEISRYDPVAIAIGMRPGQICKIIRPSKTAITTDYYRICSQ